MVLLHLVYLLVVLSQELSSVTKMEVSLGWSFSAEYPFWLELSLLLCLDGLLLGLDGELKCRGCVEVTYRKLCYDKLKKNGAWLKLNRGLSSLLPLVSFARASPLYSILRILRTLPIQGHVKGLQTLTSLDLTTKGTILVFFLSRSDRATCKQLSLVASYNIATIAGLPREILIEVMKLCNPLDDIYALINALPSVTRIDSCEITNSWCWVA